jgi:aspartate aminotransferase-like enzyme
VSLGDIAAGTSTQRRDLRHRHRACHELSLSCGTQVEVTVLNRPASHFEPVFTLTAGPAGATPDTLAALGRPVIYHCDPAFVELHADTVVRPFPFTPSVSDVYALHACLGPYLAEGPAAVQRRHQVAARPVRAGAEALGLEL